MSRTSKKLVSAIKEAGKSKTSGYDTTATVKRVEGNTAWIHIPGGVGETPAKLTIDAAEGDTVQVRVADGKAWLTGNSTAPPTDDTIALAARIKAAEADIAAGKAYEEALKAGEANKYVTKITGYSGVTVHDANDTTNFAQVTSTGFNVVVSGSTASSFEATEATWGSGSGLLKYSTGEVFQGFIEDSHRIVLSKNTDDSGYRNDATLSSKTIEGLDAATLMTVPFSFINCAHWDDTYSQGNSKNASAVSLYAWGGTSLVPASLILTNEEGTSELSVDTDNFSLDSTGLTLTGDVNVGNIVCDSVVAESAIEVTDANGYIVATDVGATNITCTEAYINSPENLLVLDNTSISFTLTIAKSSSTTATSVTVTKTGYYPLAIAGYNTGGPGAYFSYLRLTSASSGSATVTYRAKNTTSSAFEQTAAIDLLWVRIGDGT